MSDLRLARKERCDFPERCIDTHHDGDMHWVVTGVDPLAIIEQVYRTYEYAAIYMDDEDPDDTAVMDDWASRYVAAIAAALVEASQKETDK